MKKYLVKSEWKIDGVQMLGKEIELTENEYKEYSKARIKLEEISEHDNTPAHDTHE